MKQYRPFSRYVKSIELRTILIIPIATLWNKEMDITISPAPIADTGQDPVRSELNYLGLRYWGSMVEGYRGFFE